ncbi:Signal peptide, CUB and EGF-like domain-containing protein 3 [Holothuria leucospilota]|uniref:Signal peptide, CUB and EGF-like domain-containing protein 3 n=1 Tax=Holothuria leucospilota TaxID=206669 RepID=A0A9Q1BCY9_HOLLE|nr:Signal peptide, CUB and EGF-like domain-containing protein 3 [Holothuria leucospilota]
MTLNCETVILPSPTSNLNIQCVSTSDKVVIEVEGIGEPRYAFLFGGFECGNISKLFTNSVNCTSCPTGTYGNKMEEGCSPCPAGFYQDRVGTVPKEAGAISCKTCNPGTFVPLGVGNSSKSCQVCPQGTNKTRYAGFRACFCLENYYRKDRFGKCLLFFCDSFFLDELKNSSISLLHSDYSINCNTTSHDLHKLSSVPLLIFVTCFPAAIFAFLSKYSKVDTTYGNFTKYPTWIYFFCENYRLEYWYWEIIELKRKLVMTLFVVINEQKGLAKICELSFSAFFIILYIQTRPMKDTGEARLQLTSLLLLHFHVVFAAVELSEDMRGAIFVLICVLNTGFALFVAGKPIMKCLCNHPPS